MRHTPSALDENLLVHSRTRARTLVPVDTPSFHRPYCYRARYRAGDLWR